MPRKNTPTPPKRAPKIDPRRNLKKKPCSFCMHGVGSVDYKDLAQLRKYISDRGKIRGRKVSGNCQQHQRDITDAIKTARELALLPYTQRTVTERRGRGGRDDRRPRENRDGGENETTESTESSVTEADVVEMFEDAAVETAAEEVSE
jgi:small subunit ribosomal protein S18